MTNMIRPILRLIHISAALLLLKGSVVVKGQSTGVYSIYTLPPFAITLFSGWTITDNDLPPTASALQSIVQSYLYDYFHASSLQSDFEAEINQNSISNNGSTGTGSTTTFANMVLHSVELQISVRMIDSVRIWAELYGNVAFLEQESTSQSQTQNRPTQQQMHDLMDAWIAKAFDQQTSLGMFRQRLISKANDNLVLLNLKTVEVTLDVQAGPPPPITTPTVKTEQTNGTWSTPEYVLMGTLLFFIASAGAAIYIFVNIERFKYRRDHEFESLQRQADQQQQQEHFQDHYLPPSDSYDQYYTGSPAGRDVVPIVNADGSRRYVDPSLPHQLYYGASHLHMERGALEQQYDTLGRMDPFRRISSWLPKFNIVTGFLGESKQGEEDLPFVYRDFPRHDGTPCLIYNPREEEEEIEFDHDNDDDYDAQTPYTHSPVSAFAIDMGDIVGFSAKPDKSSNSHADDDKPLPSNSMHSTNSKQSISSTNSLEQFIERLENLYQLKQKQYKQRMEMERERRERKLTKKTRAVPVSSKTPSPSHDLSSPTPPATTTLAPVITPDDSGIDTPLKSNLSSSLAPCTPDTVSTTTSSVSHDTPTIQTPPTAEATTTTTMIMA